MTSFLISGEDREKLSYVLVNRVRELQEYELRVEELQDNLRNPTWYRIFRGCPDDCQGPGAGRHRGAYALGVYYTLSIFLSYLSFDTNGNLLVDSNGNLVVSDSSMNRRNHYLRTRAFTIDQWINIVGHFFEQLGRRCDDPVLVEMVRAFDMTGPMSVEFSLLLDGDDVNFHLFNAKMMLGHLQHKKAAWTLEIEDLRRELDHMGDKILALITDFSLNR